MLPPFKTAFILVNKHELLAGTTFLIRTPRPIRFWSYDKRVLILYDGVHYDPLVLEPFDSSLPIQSIFSTDNASILVQAQEIATEARQSYQFTDVTNFSIPATIT
jgi:ubiquitin thioesterase OTU1